MKLSSFFKSIPLLALGLAAFGASSSEAQSIYTSGHGDVGAGYDAVSKEFEPHWHMGSGAVIHGSPLIDDEEYEPANLVAQTTSTRNSPNGLSSLIGVADGTSIYVMGSSAYQPNLGFGVEELDPADWDGPITLTLTGWDVPSGAEFALYTTNIAGTTVADGVFSTFSPSSTFSLNSFTMIPGDHVHFQWGFTQLGTYTFDLTWSGTHVSDGAISTTESFTVQVVPEPSSAMLLGLSLAGAAVLRRRRKRINSK